MCGLYGWETVKQGLTSASVTIPTLVRKLEGELEPWRGSLELVGDARESDGGVVEFWHLELRKQPTGVLTVSST